MAEEGMDLVCELLLEELQMEGTTREGDGSEEDEDAGEGGLQDHFMLSEEEEMMLQEHEMTSRTAIDALLTDLIDHFE